MLLPVGKHILRVRLTPVVQVNLVLARLVIAVADVNCVRRNRAEIEFRVFRKFRMPRRPCLRDAQMYHQQRHYLAFLHISYFIDGNAPCQERKTETSHADA